MDKRIQFFALVLLGIIIYIVSDCYLLNDTMMMLNMIMNAQCLYRYPNTYYRKQFVNGNDTYHVYGIQIGKIYSKYLSPLEIDDLSEQISNDLLWFKWPINKNGSSTIKRKDLYHTYYKEFHRNTNNICAQNQNDTIDFFEFIYFGGKHTNNPKETAINWYKLLPIQDILNNSYYTTKAKHIGDHLNDEYYLPQLYTYVLSVDKYGYLPSLQLRFGQIVNKIQHDEMKHLMLNNNKRHILWAGEFYYIYDYKWRKYVLLVDNASGHWKPNADKIPHYLQRLLVKTLFPTYNVSILDDNVDDIYQYKSYYRPLILLGYHDYPWHELKSILFPVVDDIKHLYKARKIERIAKLTKEIHARYARYVQMKKNKRAKIKR